MHFVERVWTAVTCVMSWLTLSPTETQKLNQYPLGAQFGHNPSISQSSVTTTVQPPPSGPTFKPPTGVRGDLPGGDFQCEYPDMHYYEACTTGRDRGCWLRNTQDLTEYNIYTDYEKITPKGIDRHYTLNATDLKTLNADGIVDACAKVFYNATAGADNSDPFPGPWIQGCWGDVRLQNTERHLRDLKLTLTADAPHHGQQYYERQRDQRSLARYTAIGQHADGRRERRHAVSHPTQIQRPHASPFGRRRVVHLFIQVAAIRQFMVPQPLFGPIRRWPARPTREPVWASETFIL